MGCRAVFARSVRDDVDVFGKLAGEDVAVVEDVAGGAIAGDDGWGLFAWAVVLLAELLGDYGVVELCCAGEIDSLGEESVV